MSQSLLLELLASAASKSAYVEDLPACTQTKTLYLVFLKSSKVKRVKRVKRVKQKRLTRRVACCKEGKVVVRIKERELLQNNTAHGNSTKRAYVECHITPGPNCFHLGRRMGL